MTEQRKRKKKKHNIVAQWLGYAALRIAVFLLLLFPVRWSLAFAAFLGRLLWKHYERGRLRAMENLRASFPDKDDAWCESVGRRSFEQLVMLVVDILYTPRLVNRDTWKKYSTYKSIEKPKWMMQGGQGFLLVTAHYANFEIPGYLMGVFGFKVYSIARPLDNPFINRWLYGIREKRGQTIIDKKGATEKMEQILAEHATLGFIADQDAGRKGVFVDFFGRKASSYKSIALLAMQYNMPIAVGYSRRVGNDFFFEIACSRLIMPHEWADQDDPLHWITQEYNKAIEDFIREDPTQYWWLHRRWKTRPREERLAQEQPSL